MFHVSFPFASVIVALVVHRRFHPAPAPFDLTGVYEPVAVEGPEGAGDGIGLALRRVR